MSQNALLLVGSPAQEGSSSHMLGAYLLDQLRKQGFEVDKEYIYRAVRAEDRMTAVQAKMESADLVVLSFPLYVDSIPSPMIRFMEMVHERRLGRKVGEQRMIAICNSGFPEAHHNDLAVRICSVFARDTGFRWAGGLSVGEGGGVGRRDLVEAGGMMRNFRTALDLAARALAEGKDVPSEAQELMSRGFVAPWLYTWIVNRNWKKEGRKNRVDLLGRPLV